MHRLDAGIMPFTKRFSLSTLLLAMLLASLALGYAQWRRQRLVAEVAALQQIGVSGLGLSRSWLWPVVSESASIIVTPRDTTPTEETLARLRSIGVSEVKYLLLDDRGKPIEWRRIDHAERTRGPEA